LSRLVQSIETCERNEVVIARNGRPVALLTSLRPAMQQRCLGVAKGNFRVPASIDDDNSLILDLLEQP
jgi:antitoxin (DNA-binding transcriptional repressor) of toxin-antitoxin stability system